MNCYLGSCGERTQLRPSNNFTLRMEVHQIHNEIPKDSLERLNDGMTRRVDALMRTKMFSTLSYSQTHLGIIETFLTVQQ